MLDTQPVVTVVEKHILPALALRTGLVKTTLSAEALEFTVNALVATQEKLDVFLSKIPSEAVQEARAELAAEQKGM